MSTALVRVTLVAGLVVLGACSDGGGDDAVGGDPSTSSASGSTEVTTSGPEAPTSTSAVTTDVPGAPTTEATGATAGPTTTAAPDRGECLIGSWVVTQEQMNAFYDGLMTTVDAPIGIDATGSAGLTFDADGTYAWTPAFDLSVDVAGQGGTGRIGGSIDGVWTAEDGTLTTASETNSLVLEITVNGVTFAGSDLANGLLSSSPVNGVTYSCAGPTPVIDFATSDPEVTVPVTLTPA